MRNGRRGSFSANEAMVGARSPPILADVEHKPIAEFLKIFSILRCSLLL